MQRRKVDGMANLTKMVNLAKIYHRFNTYSSWMSKSGPLESGEFDEMANKAKKQNLAIIRPRCNKLLIGAPSLVTNFANFSNYAAKEVLKRGSL